MFRVSGFYTISVVFEASCPERPHGRPYSSFHATHIQRRLFSLRVGPNIFIYLLIYTYRCMHTHIWFQTHFHIGSVARPPGILGTGPLTALSRSRSSAWSSLGRMLFGLPGTGCLYPAETDAHGDVETPEVLRSDTVIAHK